MITHGHMAHNRGSTLVSLLTALLLMSLILTAAGILLSFAIKSYQTNVNSLEVQENLRLGMDRLTRELRQSSGVISFDNSGTGRLNFSARSSEVITYRIGLSSDYETASQLLRAVNGAGNNSVARYITNLKVEPLSTGSANRTYYITITGSKGSSGPLSLSTTVMVRN